MWVTFAEVVAAGVAFTCTPIAVWDGDGLGAVAALWIQTQHRTSKDRYGSKADIRLMAAMGGKRTLVSRLRA